MKALYKPPAGVFSTVDDLAQIPGVLRVLEASNGFGLLGGLLGCSTPNPTPTTRLIAAPAPAISPAIPQEDFVTTWEVLPGLGGRVPFDPKVLEQGELYTLEVTVTPASDAGMR